MGRSWNENLGKALKVAGELCVTPGASLLVQGKVKSGAIHAGIGLLGGALFGFPAIAIVGASSFFKSLSSGGAAEDPILEKVKEQVREGLTLEEIKAGIAEDVEDRYHEVLSNQGQVDQGVGR